MENQKIGILLGASGLIGSHVLELLLKNGTFQELTTLGRRSLNVSPSSMETIYTHQVVEFSNLKDLKTLLVGSDLICCLGTTIKKAKTQENFKRIDHDLPLQCFKIAKENGIKRVILISSVDANPKSKSFYLRTKGELEENLIKLGFDKTIIVRPSLLLGDRQESRLGEKIFGLILNILSPFMIGPLKKYRPVEAKTVASNLVTFINETNQPQVYICERDQLLQ